MLTAYDALMNHTPDALIGMMNIGKFSKRELFALLIRSLVGGVNIVTPSLNIVRAAGVSAGAGAVNLYTVPAGRRAFWLSFGYTNTTAGALTLRQQLRMPDTSLRNISNAVALAANANGQTSNAIVMHEGETAVVDASGAGVNINGRIVEFDARTELSRREIFNLALGDNVLYTVPAGRVGIIPSASSLGIVTASPALIVSNNGGVGARNYQAHIAPAGSLATGAATRNGSVTAIGNGSFLSIHGTGARGILAAGESLIVNTDGGEAGQWAFANIVERAAA
jgi:hypothetical protein